MKLISSIWERTKKFLLLSYGKVPGVPGQTSIRNDLQISSTRCGSDDLHNACRLYSSSHPLVSKDNYSDSPAILAPSFKTSCKSGPGGRRRECWHAVTGLGPTSIQHFRSRRKATTLRTDSDDTSLSIHTECCRQTYRARQFGRLLIAIAMRPDKENMTELKCVVGTAYVSVAESHERERSGIRAERHITWV